MSRTAGLRQNYINQPTYNSIMLFGKKKEPNATANTQPAAPKRIGLPVAKYEVIEDKINFFNQKGLFKKRWIVIKEIPIYEITAVECQYNWISLTWNNAQYSFILKTKGESFIKLQEQIQAMQQEHQIKVAQAQRQVLRKTELLSVINKVLPVIDSSFDVLMGLHAKRIDWVGVETAAQPIAGPFSFEPQTFGSLSLDFSKVIESIKSETAKETSKETLVQIKAIHNYFSSLNPAYDIADVAPNFKQTLAVIVAYLTINDLLLAKTVGEKDSSKEVAYLEQVLSELADGTSVKLTVSDVMVCVDRLGFEDQCEVGAADVRALFREQLKLL